MRSSSVLDGHGRYRVVRTSNSGSSHPPRDENIAAILVLASISSLTFQSSLSRTKTLRPPQTKMLWLLQYQEALDKGTTVGQGDELLMISFLGASYPFFDKCRLRCSASPKIDFRDLRRSALSSPSALDPPIDFFCYGRA